MRTGSIYTETIVHLAPERFAADVPYQIAIIDLAEGGRLTARIEGERVAIGDHVTETRAEGGISYFRKS
jgi:uncharacterized OB-fold protein